MKRGAAASMLPCPRRVSLTQLQSLPTTDLSEESRNVFLTLKPYPAMIFTLDGYRKPIDVLIFVQCDFIFIVECILTLLTVTSSLLPTLRKPKGSQERAIQQQHLQRPTSITTVNVAYVPSFLWDVFFICTLYHTVHV